MSGDREEQIGRLCVELAAALAAHESIDVGAWAQRFELSESEVQRSIAALAAIRDALDDDALPGASNPLPPPDLPDDYELLGELGRGGMGVVYRVRQRSLDRELAVKVLRPGEPWFGDAVARFEREAKSLARLRHRHIVSVHEVGRSDGLVWFSMDYIAGETLATRLEHGPLMPSEAVRLLRQVASAIAFAHGKGVVHRDLKPANILIDRAGDAFVVDFGLARDLAAGAGLGAATLSGQLLGTPGYMSPEQALGERARIGEASDVYALGVVLYECLTGAAPFAGLPLAQLMHAVIERDPLPVRRRNGKVPVDLEVICDKAMRKRPEHRYATVQAFAEDLERFAIGREILARRRSVFARMAKVFGRNRRAVVAATAVVLMVLAFGWWFVLPAVLRRQGVAMAERLHLAGNAAAAATVYRDALAGLDAGALSPRDRLGYVRVLNDAAGTMYLRGADADAKTAAELADEAARVAASAPDDPRGIFVGDAAAEVAQLSYERRRNAALRGDLGAASCSATAFDVELAADRRAAAADTDRLLDVVQQEFLAKPATMQWCASFVDVLAVQHRLPDPVRARVHRLARVYGEFATDTALDPLLQPGGLLDRLVALAADRKLPLDTRRSAAAMFHRFGWLPFLCDWRQFRSGSSSWPECVVEAPDLDWLVGAWRELQGLDRLAAHRRRAQLVAERLLAASAPLDLGNHALHGLDLRQWLREHSGLYRTDRDHLASWLRERALGDPRQWLLDTIGWRIAPDAVRAIDVLARLRRGDPHRESLLRLLELVAPAGTPIPHVTAVWNQAALARWEVALNDRPDLRRRLRVALFVMIDGAPTPALAWQHQAVISPDAAIELLDEVAMELPFPNAYLGRRLPGEWLRQDATTPRFGGRAQVEWDGQQLALRAEGGLRTGEVGTRREMIPAENRVPEGLVGFVGGSRVRDQAGSASLTSFTLMTLRPLDESAEAWASARWRDEVAASLSRLAGDGVRFAVHNLNHIVSATLFPLPDRLAELRAINEQIEAGEPMFRDHLREVRRASRLLAGDTTAIAADAVAAGTASLPVDPDFWLRLLLTTENDDVRRAAWERLEPEALAAGSLRTLEAAVRGGLAVPAAFAARLPTAASAARLWWRANASAIALAVANVVVVLIALVGLCRGRARRRFAGGFLLLAGWAMTGWSLWWDGTEWTPVWLGHALHVVGCIALCLDRRGLLSLLTVLWWVGATIAHATGQLANPIVVWAIAVLLLVCQNLQLAGAPSRRSATGRRRSNMAGSGVPESVSKKTITIR